MSASGDYISPRDMVGRVFGDLTVVSLAEKHHYPCGVTALWWKCVCKCGKEKTVDGRNLRSGRTKNCGCDKTSKLIKFNYKHGGAADKEKRLYTIWKGMKQRCENPKNKSYKYYGARGIAVCDQWSSDYKEFEKWALQSGYDENALYGTCTIDRINNDSGYSPDNCQWVSLAEQNKNKRRAVL